MKASELMLNDWVQHEGTPYRVRLIADMGVVTADDGICHFHFISKYLDPIPLTEEILVKNGWFALDEYRYEGDVALAKESSGFRLKNTNICVNSVHQLQHLLRLVGVQKEIEL